MFNRQRLRRLPLDIQLEVETLISDLRGEGPLPSRRADEAAAKAVDVSGSNGGFTARAFSATMSVMDLAAFRASLTLSSPPLNLSPALQALWLEARGDWDGAHDSAQADEGGAGDWVHAYLHRKEGDSGNAAYWYRRARKPVCRTSVDDEWAAIASELLKQEGGVAA
jgi:hypothetical protein